MNKYYSIKRMNSPDKILPAVSRIGVFSKPLDNWTSGSGHHLDEMMKHVLDLNDQAEKPFEFTFIHYKKSINPIYARVKELIIPRNPLCAASVLRPYRFNLLHYSPLSIYAPVFRLNVKKMATIHGAEEFLYPQGYSFIARMHEKFAMPILARKLDAIATVSEASKRYYVSAYGVNPEKIFLTVNGLSADYHVIAKGKLSALETFGIKRPYVFHISRYSHRKNPACVLESFSLFARKNPEYVLVCAGKGWNCAEVVQRAAELGIRDKLITPGFVSDAQAAQLYNGAAVFVFPSFAEGFGMPNVEAMACGCPVVTGNIFAIPEVVGNAAVLLNDVTDSAECAAALERIVSDTDFRHTLINRGLERVKRYDWTESAKILFNKYTELLRP